MKNVIERYIIIRPANELDRQPNKVNVEIRSRSEELDKGQAFAPCKNRDWQIGTGKPHSRWWGTQPEHEHDIYASTSFRKSTIKTDKGGQQKIWSSFKSEIDFTDSHSPPISCQWSRVFFLRHQFWWQFSIFGLPSFWINGMFKLRPQFHRFKKRSNGSINHFLE